MGINRIVIAVLGIVVFSGCATLGMKFSNEHTKAHTVEIQVSQNLNKYMKSVDLSHRLYDGKTFLAVSGSLQRPLGIFKSSLLVKAKFYDENDQVIVESIDRVSFSRMGARTHRRYNGSLFLKIEDNERIKRCDLELSA